MTLPSDCWAPTFSRRQVIAAALAGGGTLAFGAIRASRALADDRIIQMVAGDGQLGVAVDGQLATQAMINQPRGLAVLPSGSFFIADAFANRVYQVDTDGTIHTVAGTGVAGYSGDGGPATNAKLSYPHAFVLLPGGGYLISDATNFRIRKVDANGIITTVAGTGIKGFSGDGGPATAAKISACRGICHAVDGGFLIADSDNNRIRRVYADGTIRTVAGTGANGFGGDGGPALDATLNEPFGVSTFPGGYLIADTTNQRIRRVTHDGARITTIAGTGVKGYSGDNGQAVDAEISAPHNAMWLPDGSVLIADEGNNRVRRVFLSGRIVTDAGNGTAGLTGNSGPPEHAELNQPKALAPYGSGYLVADAGNSCVRYVGPPL